MTPNSTHTDATSTGGAATNRGIWYQALWCVLQSAQTRLQSVERSEDGPPNALRLTLEPLAGDVLLERAGTRRVVQIKTLCRGTWSLKDVVTEVYPDLYGAVNPNSTIDITYEFVTEGRIGAWKNVLRLFENLGRRVPSDVTDGSFCNSLQLDDMTPLEFGGHNGEFWDGRTTERGIFDRIVAHLRLANDVGREPIALTRWKTWRLLSRFRFQGDIKERQIIEHINEALLPVLAHRGQSAELLNAMVGWMINRASENDAVITPAELFSAYGLDNVIPVSRWTVIAERCRQYARRQLDLLNYHPQLDVRGDERSTIAPLAPWTAVTGGVGDGRTWYIYALAHHQVKTPTVLLESTGNHHADLQKAADRIWKSVCGHEDSISLEGLAARRADVLRRPISEPWLTICITRFRDKDCLPDLLSLPVEDWGVHVVLHCDEDTAASLAEHGRRHPGRVSIKRVTRFTPDERDEYLQRRLGDLWADLPGDVRELLRTPQLADMYCDLSAQIGQWKPRDEYELVNRYWRRISEAASAPHRRDALRLARLAATLLDGGAYPWEEFALDQAGLDAPTIDRLVISGWIRLRADRTYEIPHIRLLNFAVAQGLLIRLQEHAITEEEIATILDRVGCDTEVSPFFLGYVLMDWVYLQLQRDFGATSRVLRLLESKRDHLFRENLHLHLLPTLGTACVQLLFDRLADRALNGQWWEAEPILGGLSTRPLEELQASLLRMIADDRPTIRRAAVRLLARRPSVEALDAAWNVHLDMQANPSCYFSDKDEHETWFQVHRLYEESFGALCECARLCPEWIVRMICDRNSSAERLQDLAYLAANAHDKGQAWHASKIELIARLPPDRRRSLALNIGIWRDVTEDNHLEEWKSVQEDHLGPAAVRALAQIDPQRAAAALADLPEDLLYMCRNWYLPRLFATAPIETNDALFARVLSSSDTRPPSVLQGSENSIEPRLLELLLNRLEASIRDILEQYDLNVSDNGAKDLRNALFPQLELIAEMCRIDLLDCFAKYRKTSLETRLVDLLIRVIKPRCTLSNDSLSRKPALEILLRIGGEGYRRVVNTFLAIGNQYGKLDAIRSALSDFDAQTIEELRKIGTGSVLWDNEGYLLQVEAARALAATGDVAALLEVCGWMGIHTPHDTERWLATKLEVGAASLARAEKILREANSPLLPGTILWYGFIGHTQCVPQLQELLEQPPTEDVELATVVALGYLGKATSSAIELIAKRLEVPRLNHHALRALFRIHLPIANRALLAWAIRNKDAGLAISLTDSADVREQALMLIIEELANLTEVHHFETCAVLLDVLKRVRAEELEIVFRRCPNLRGLLREIAFDHVSQLPMSGSADVVLRGLSVYDPRAAYLAARRALADRSARARNVYPAILARTDPVESRGLFLSLAFFERDKSVRRAMANTLRTLDEEWLHQHLTSESATNRAAACELASVLAESSSAVRERLTDLLRDPDDRVALRAEQALAIARQQLMARELVNRLSRHEYDKNISIWTILGAAITVGDVGFEGDRLPEWVLELRRNVMLTAPAVRVILDAQVQKARKDALQKSYEDGQRERM